MLRAFIFEAAVLVAFALFISAIVVWSHLLNSGVVS